MPLSRPRDADSLYPDEIAIKGSRTGNIIMDDAAAHQLAGDSGTLREGIKRSNTENWE